MKRVILTTFFCICVPFLAFGLTADELNRSKDSTQNGMDQPVLQVVGASVYYENRLLTRAEVVNILGSYPEIAMQYDRAAATRHIGTRLLLNGAVVTTGGIIIMVRSICESNRLVDDPNTGYSNKYYLGLIVTSIGELILDGGIACTIVGKINIRKSISNYNNTVDQFGLKPVPVNYQFGLLDNGNFGLRLCF